MNAIVANKGQVQPWKQFRIGGGNTQQELFSDVRKVAQKMGEEVPFLFQGLAVQDAEEEVYTTILSFSDLSGNDGLFRAPFLKEDFLQQWSVQNAHLLPEGYDEIGLLPNEAGAAIRMQYQDQSTGESLLIATLPLRDRIGAPRVLVVARAENGTRVFSSMVVRPESLIAGDKKIVFRLRKKKNG